MRNSYLINYPVTHPLIQAAVPAFRILGLDWWEQVYMVLENIRTGYTGLVYERYIAQVDQVMQEEMAYYVDSPAEQFISAYYLSNYDAIVDTLRGVWSVLEMEFAGYRTFPFCADRSIQITQVDLIRHNALIYTEPNREIPVRRPPNFIPAPTALRGNVRATIRTPNAREPKHRYARGRFSCGPE